MAEFCNKIITYLGFVNKGVKTEKSKSFLIGCHKSMAILKTERSSSQNLDSSSLLLFWYELDTKLKF